LTIYGVATAMERSPDQVAAMKEAGWEIASHGLKWVEHKDMPIEEERRQIAEAIRIHTNVTGERPLGWYTGRCSMNTTQLVMEEGGFLYSSDDYADDLPYWLPKPGGGKHLIIPYTLDANDMRFATPQGFNTGEHFYQYLKDSFDCLYEEGGNGSPKMMSVGLHCRLVGRPGRALGLAKFLKYIASKQDVWIARRIDIAKHWHSTHA
jgi:peptidoglycan/xylan/chitin deacetylase (PgdA/CDA1 family)